MSLQYLHLQGKTISLNDRGLELMLEALVRAGVQGPGKKLINDWYKQYFPAAVLANPSFDGFSIDELRDFYVTLESTGTDPIEFLSTNLQHIVIDQEKFQKFLTEVVSPTLIQLRDFLHDILSQPKDYFLILQELSDELFRLAPLDWIRAEAVSKKYIKLYSVKIIYFDESGKPLQPKHGGRTSEIFESLRHYRLNENQEPYTIAKFSLSVDGTYTIDYQY